MIHPPPRFLLGVTLLFWGVMIDWPLAGLAMALVVEGGSWVRVRWDFDNDSLCRAWRLCVLCIAAAATMILVDGQRYTALPSLVSWLPALLMPVQFIQTYGTRRALPASEFSPLARSRRIRNQRLGLANESAEFDFGNALFIVTLVAATLGIHSSSPVYLPALLVLLVWKFLTRSNFRVLLPLMAILGLLSLAGEAGLRKFSDWIGSGWSSNQFRSDPDFNPTMIGSCGEVSLSPAILWRLRVPGGGPPPRLLRTNTFNMFLGANWRNARYSAGEAMEPERHGSEAETVYYLRPSPVAERTPPPFSYDLRGTFREEMLLPAPGDAEVLHGFDFQSLEVDVFGRIHPRPKQPVVNGSVAWGGGSSLEGPPSPEEDLRVPRPDRQTLRKILRPLQLDGKPLDDQVATIHNWFFKNFQYSRKLTIRRPEYQSADPSAISQFLTTTRSGHCEYFATAAVLLLRELGIPARYATGYVVVERGRDGFIVRGTHGHAWCRYWNADAGHWMDLDATPPGASFDSLGWWQQLSDSLALFREDFFLWRNQETVGVAILWSLIIIGLIAGGWVARRLWRTRKRMEHPQGGSHPRGSSQPVRTPLHALEKPASTILGPRPPSTPYARWLSGLANATGCQLPQLAEALDLHQRLRYDPQPADPSDWQRLATLARDVEVSLKR